MASLSLQLAQWNWITRADAGLPDGGRETKIEKTLVKILLKVIPDLIKKEIKRILK